MGDGPIPAKEVAKRLGVTLRTLTRWTQAGHISAPRLGPAKGGRGHTRWFSPKVFDEVARFEQKRRRASHRIVRLDFASESVWLDPEAVVGLSAYGEHATRVLLKGGGSYVVGLGPAQVAGALGWDLP